MTTAQREAKQLTELLIQQRDVYQKLGQFAASQAAAVQDDQSETLLRILSQRQQLITELTEINDRLEPFRSRWDELREQLSATERLRVADLVEEVQGLLGQILQRDEQDSDELRRRSDQVRNEAASTSMGRNLNAAYAARSYAAAQPRYIDQHDAEEAKP
jgi:predicted nuclease with TOPRIM domain